MGASKVIIIDLVEERLKAAERLGAAETINAGEVNVVERVRQLTGGYGVDTAIEAIGSSATWEQALQMVRRGGTVLEFGGCPPGTEIKVNAEMLHYGEETILGSFHATPLHFRKALNLIASRSVDVRPLITRKMKLEEIEGAFEVLSTSKSEIKIAVNP